ncbi:MULTISPECIES: Pr6Pr family membrane protein [Amycolatopsis]|uniref:Pr6Pr family membrane protein n=1 Tax=Amycolatopsis thermalba TaxID=944492 RepID=A0ABY4P5T9_9PSEU|nr:MULTISPECIES: Pr6Pr family membrane protein [Amycolatopsis]OXM72169.1 F420-dependent oxidoreductase [Amycolatopsis sp. KNN50.9b]UQS27651.1 Pr6Pr family membrane protein [Amycolatopsis thermalba]
MRIARVWFGLHALVVLAGVVMQLFVTSGVMGGRYESAAARMANVFAYFTIQSNLIVGFTGLLLAIRPHRTSTVFRTLRLDGVLAIAVTGIVFHLVLAGLQDLTGWAWVANLLLHTVSPLLGVLGWLLFGPRGAVTSRIIGWSAVYPLAWVAFTLVRGAIDGFYPYPFIDVTALGYPRVAVNCLVIAVLFVALAFGAMLLDRLLGRGLDDADEPGGRREVQHRPAEPSRE